MCDDMECNRDRSDDTDSDSLESDMDSALCHVYFTGRIWNNNHECD